MSRWSLAHFANVIDASRRRVDDSPNAKPIKRTLIRLQRHCYLTIALCWSEQAGMKWLSRILQRTLRSFETGSSQLTRPPIAATTSTASLTSPIPRVQSSVSIALLRGSGAMAPKQSTLGYVKPSQATLGCDLDHAISCFTSQSVLTCTL